MAEGLVPAVRFTITRENTSEAHPPKTFTLKLGAETPIRIGRAPANDIIVGSRGVSQYHAELRVLRLEGESEARLCIRDLSMNGTGLKRPDGKAPQHLEKRTDVAVQDDSVILVPMMIKVSTDPNDRAWLKIDVEETTMEPADAPKPKANKSSKRAAEHATQEATEEDAEKARTKFVELLLNTREISAGTTYDEAKKLLASADGWHAVDEATRKECFDIFVEHLGSHQSSKKKDKKKKKDKGKEKGKKGKKHDDEEASGEKDAPEVVPEPSHDRKRKRRAGSGGGSPDRTRRRDKKAGNRRSRSASRGDAGAGKRRRRGRSSSA